MIGWLIGGIAVIALIAASSNDEKKDTVASPRGNLPLSGKPRSACPNVHLPIFEGVGKGELIDIPEALRSVYSEPLNIDPAMFVGDNEMAKAARETNAAALDNLAMQAECAGYLGVAQKLYDHAKKIRSGGASTPTASSSINNDRDAIAQKATTRERLEEDFAELPDALRDYVLGFVMDPTTMPDVFVDGANILVGGDPENVARVGIDFGLDSVKDAIEESGLPLPDPSLSSGSPNDFTVFDASEFAKWFFPRAAARLRRIAIERAEMLGLPNPFPSAPAAI